jgi:hypothetical protein
MDEYFGMFLEEFGEPFNRREVPISSLERYRHRLPEQLLRYWEEYGWASYARGLFWIVNPQEYEGVISAWLQGTEFEDKDEFHVIARSAFGQIFLWGEKFGPAVRLSTLNSYAIVSSGFNSPPENLDFEVKCFFAFLDKATRDPDVYFESALCRLGLLNDTQMYGFVPALALGGQRDAEKLERVSAVEHMTFLAQLDQLTILRLPE